MKELIPKLPHSQKNTTFSDILILDPISQASRSQSVSAATAAVIFSAARGWTHSLATVEHILKKDTMSQKSSVNFKKNILKRKEAKS